MSAKTDFVDDQLYELDSEHGFNAGREPHRRVKKPKDRRRVKAGLERGWDLREQGADVDTIRREVKKAMFGSGFFLMLLTFIIQNWGDDIVAWIISKLLPAVMGAAPSEVWIVGRYIMDVPNGIAWELQGAYSDKAQAVAACRDRTYFIGPMPVDWPDPHKTIPWGGCTYPLVT